MTRIDTRLGTQGRLGKVRDVIPPDRGTRKTASRTLSIRDDLPSRIKTIVNAVNGLRLFVDVILYDGDPQVKMRAYLRGDLRKAPPRELRDIIEQGRELADGEVWQGRHLQIRRVESYLEVFPGGEELPPPFHWEEARALSEAVVLHHDREVFAAAVEKGDPRYLVLLTGELSAAAKAVRKRIYWLDHFLEKRAAAIQRAKEQRYKFQPNPEFEANYREKFYEELGRWYALPGVPSERAFLSQQSVSWIRDELAKVLPLYEGYLNELDPAIEKRFLRDQRYIAFAMFLDRLAVEKTYKESDFAPSPLSLGPGQLGEPYEAYQVRIAYWARSYIHAHRA